MDLAFSPDGRRLAVASRQQVKLMDTETAEQVGSLMAKGFAGTIFLTTDDVYADYEQLQSRGVEFSERPEERPYGIDSGFHDPSALHDDRIVADLSDDCEIV